MEAALSVVGFSTPGLAEFVFLALLALLIFGPERLPEMARTLGRTINRVKTEASDTLDELKQSADFDEVRQAANVDELREVADELRSTSSDLQRRAALPTSTSSGRGDRSATAEAREAAGDAPPPFDPDAP